ncbi:MAG TPA: glycosyltransferase [Chitinophagaceae bacterium]|nr:glycosyltransferase [Chitinophagaceae bacterium]
MAPDISVIICTYNRERYLVEAMRSLVEQDFDKKRFEVIVVNNNSQDNTEKVCGEFITTHPEYQMHYYNETEQGSSAARNNGARHAKGSLLIFMDDDAIAEKDFLKNTWQFHSAHPDIHGFGGRIIPRYIPAEPAWMSHYVSALVGNFDYAPVVTEFKPNKYPLESNMVITKKAFDEIGGFNMALPGVKGNLRIGGEGKDLYFRLKEKGQKIFYVPDLKVHHVVEVNRLNKEYLYRVASGIGRGERQRISSKGRMAFYGKLAEYIFKLGAAVLIGLFYILSFRPAKAWPVIQFRIDAIKGLTGN